MNKKLLIGLAAVLITTSAACQNNSQPSAAPAGNGASATGQAQTVPPAAKPTEKSEASVAPVGAGTPAQPSKPSDVAPGSAQQPAVPPSASTSTAAPITPQATQQPAPAPQAAAKLYKMNPKTYDIVPIDPASADKNVVLLTFDDGPKDKDMLEALLGTLDKHKAKAIFFVNGYRVQQKPELIKLITDHGQTIGNHSWDHIDLKKESKEKIDQQIGDVQKLVKELTGSAPQFFRPPFGSGGDLVREKAKQENMLFMTWSNGSLDWDMTVKKNDPAKVVSNVLEQLRPGSNILMHELPWTVEAMDNLLTQLEAKSYKFVDPASIDTTL
ncbi:polysaccharide deacetylase family protein [Paenibacillus agricola]|uniref:Polysaccharide deacetylase family protein n=1 Tax=Paenibacillus agricola TaxID=2716264 RepID=A0ABX0J1S9_9BACL|nr:polysaccharide deacetylase family protein [Paenibacillus agricola]NHN28753.1 polysaccharide deacetylase family protein [Paenibacillus agricola]